MDYKSFFLFWKDVCLSKCLLQFQHNFVCKCNMGLSVKMARFVLLYRDLNFFFKFTKRWLLTFVFETPKSNYCTLILPNLFKFAAKSNLNCIKPQITGKKKKKLCKYSHINDVFKKCFKSSSSSDEIIFIYLYIK